MFENLKKMQRGGSGAFFKTPAVRSPKARLIVMFGLLILVGVAYGWLQGYGSTGEDGAHDRTMGHSFDKFDRIREDDMSAIPVLSPKLSELVVDGDNAQRKVLNEDVLGYLLQEVDSTPAVYHFTRGLVPLEAGREGKPGSAETIARDPGPWRFKFFRIRGALEYLEDMHYDQLLGKERESFTSLYKGRVKVAGSENLRAVFLVSQTPMEIDFNSPGREMYSKPITDGWVNVNAIFVKRFLDENEDGSFTPALLFVATQVHREYETKDVKSLDDVGFEIIQDDPALIGTDEEDQLYRLYPRPLFRLVRYAGDRSGADGAKLREKEGLRAVSFDAKADFHRMIYKPDEVRGAYFGGLGAIARTLVEHVGPRSSNDAGVESWLTGWIVMDNYKVIKVIAPLSLARGDPDDGGSIPPDGGWKKLERIAYEGFFYKAMAYRGGGQERLVPLVVLTKLSPVAPPPSNRRAQLLFVIGFGAGIGAIVYFILREDRTKADYTRLRRRTVPSVVNTAAKSRPGADPT